MIVLTAEKISKNYGGKHLLKDVSLTIEEGDKIGVIGVNGTGKSTFLKMMAGLEQTDSGEISKSAGFRVGYLPQNPVFEPGVTVLEQAMKGSSRDYECKTILTKLGILDFDQDVTQLSGGQKKRVALAAALASEVELLILDEPTNHIDSDMVAWLETYLARYSGALLMVTHDRYFLERVTNKIVELQGGELTAYPANYSQYLELKAERESMQAATERKRQALYRKELEWIQRGARARSTKQKFRVNRFEELSQKSGSSEQSLDLSSLSARLGKKIIEVDSVSKGFGDRMLFQDFSYNLLRGDRLGVIGPNGCGKSTLLKVILGLLEPDSGEVRIGETVRVGYFSQESEEMDLSLRVIDYIKNVAEQVATPDGTLSAAQMLERFLFPSELQYTEIGRLSGGERRRLFLLRILMEAPNVLFLDEPTNDLDIQTLTILEDYLEEFPGAVVAVSHDRYFLDKVSDHIFAFESNGVRQYLGGYSDYLDRKKEEVPAEPAKKEEKQKAYRNRDDKLKFSFKEQREYDEIDTVIAALEDELTALQKQIEAEASNYALLQELLDKKARTEEALSQKMDRWVYLNDLAEKINAQRITD